jgi:hypothetical protein
LNWQQPAKTMLSCEIRPERRRPPGARLIRVKSGEEGRMGFLWGFVKAVTLAFAVVIAVLVVVDGSLLANLLGKKND